MRCFQTSNNHTFFYFKFKKGGCWSHWQLAPSSPTGNRSELFHARLKMGTSSLYIYHLTYLTTRWLTPITTLKSAHFCSLRNIIQLIICWKFSIFIFYFKFVTLKAADGTERCGVEGHWPVWLRMWTLSVPLLANFCPQYGQIFSFSPVCVWQRHDKTDMWLMLWKTFVAFIFTSVLRYKVKCDWWWKLDFIYS